VIIGYDQKIFTIQEKAYVFHIIANQGEVIYKVITPIDIQGNQHIENLG
jgi:hypothetical protein